jgi:hypothetical protein
MAGAEQDVDQVKHPEQLFVAADGVHGVVSPFFHKLI